jgi:uncharacterized membrane protein YfcA
LIVGNVDFQLLANLLVGSLPGVLVGAALSVRLPPAFVQRALAAVLLVSGSKLLAVAG